MEQFSFQDHDVNSFYDQTTPRSAASIVGNTVSVAPNARMKTYGVASVPQQTRHARRIYVGALPPNYIDEDGLRSFMNSVIAQGLGEENDHSYVLSVYINQKKCFAFVELKSIELASACLELDGIIMKNVVLRILRANEYKPELIPQSLNKVVRFDLSGFQFGAVSASSQWNHMIDSEEVFNERTLESIVQFSNLGGLESGSVTIVGFPFDESQRKPQIRGTGCSNTPKLFRSHIRKYKYGFVDNPEFDVDITKIKVLDVGDVLAGKSLEETKSNLTTTVTELILRSSVPFVIGGSMDLAFHSISGLLSSSGNKIAVIYISSHADIRILDDSRFFGSRSPGATLSCQGRYVAFAAQGSEYSKDEANFIRDRGGRLIWLTKDLLSGGKNPVTSFVDLLNEFSKREDLGALPIAITIDAGVLNAALSPFANSTNSSQGLSFSDLIGIVRAAGSDPNVVIVNVTEFTVGADDSRCSSILVDLFYHFLVGFATRKEEIDRKSGVSVVAASFSQRDLKSLYGDTTSSPSIAQQRKAFNIDAISTKLDDIRPAPLATRPPSTLSIENPESYVNSRTRPEARMDGSWPSGTFPSQPLNYGLPPNKPQIPIDQHKLLHSMSDLSRNIPSRTSTLSSMSSSSAMDRLHNRSLSSQSNRSIGTYSYSTVTGVGRNPLPPGINVKDSNISGIFSQSLPDIISELHPYDENIDLSLDGMVSRKSQFDSSNKLNVAMPSGDSTLTIPYSNMILPVDPLTTQLSPTGIATNVAFAFDDHSSLQSQQVRPNNYPVTERDSVE